MQLRTSALVPTMGWGQGAVFFEKLSYLADINAFAFSPLNLSNQLIFRIVKYAKVTEVNP